MSNDTAGTSITTTNLDFVPATALLLDRIVGEQWVPIPQALALTLKGTAVLLGDGSNLLLLIEDE